MNDISQHWDHEYRNCGIPSSIRDEASTTMLWALANWRYISPQAVPLVALDVGCGTGRNSMYMASRGVKVVAFDFSPEAITRAQARKAATDGSIKVDFIQHDLTKGLPSDAGSVDLVADIFVYKHQMDTSARKRYRDEIRRVLRQGGKLLLSLAEIRDQYYSQCPLYAGSQTDDPLYVIDPAIKTGSVLYSLESLLREFSDAFELVMSWLKIKDGEMHGKIYSRYTLATIWELKS